MLVYGKVRAQGSSRCRCVVSRPSDGVSGVGLGKLLVQLWMVLCSGHLRTSCGL